MALNSNYDLADYNSKSNRQDGNILKEENLLKKYELNHHNFRETMETNQINFSGTNDSSSPIKEIAINNII